MPMYFNIRDMAPDERKRTLDGLKRLRSKLDSEIPQKTRDDTLVLGTWNIRNFDDNRFGHGKRSLEDLFYIAEILSRFDIIAVQEICEDLRPLDKVIGLLGRTFEYILTDKTEGRAGNSERLGFIYDKAKVQFKGVAGELVLPPSMLIAAGERKLQFSRTPFMCTFQSGWFRFSLSTVHIYYGEKTGIKFQRRVEEIKKVAKFLAKRAKHDETNHILVGDFNIPSNKGSAFNALALNGFTVFQNDKGSNKDQTKFYDQISFISRRQQVQICQNKNSRGVFQFFDSVLRIDDFSDNRDRVIDALKERILATKTEIEEERNILSRARSEKKKESQRTKIEKLENRFVETKEIIEDEKLMENYFMDKWRTFHLSDHLPLWLELKIDFSREYLEGLEGA